ncbi:hypothetical protein QJS66_00230 [Kocuria rhizophila]|nr:hypothetical protein QJS66_00230 [Kocuria rhizophila]
MTGPATLSEGEALELLLTLAPWTLGGGVFVLSVLLPFAVRPLLTRWGVIDVPPNASSTPDRSCAAWASPWRSPWWSRTRGRWSSALSPWTASIALVVLAMMVASAALGWAKSRGVPIAVHLGVEALIGALGTAALIVALGVPAWWWPVVVATVAYINIANFMDGIDEASPACTAQR